jgi:hypothetical protein
VGVETGFSVKARQRCLARVGICDGIPPSSCSEGGYY